MNIEQRSLNQWLSHIESIHYSEIELGLDRITQVYKRLFPKGVPFEVITVGGTNGKGSCCAYLQGIFVEAGISVGKYTSPHISVFNERVDVNQQLVDDKLICKAFTQIENAREDIKLTYFEYATLAALCVFAYQKVDLAVMEVGLGGRLDAVNILEPQVSIITSIGLDHVDWLGDDIKVIAQEKVAIARKAKPCVVGEQTLPDGMLASIQDIGAEPVLINEQFSVNRDDDNWSIDGYLDNIPLLQSNVSHQYSNAACAVVAAVASSFDVSDKALRAGLENTIVEGRCQIVSKQPLTIVDVAHNEDSINGLIEFMASQEYSGRCLAVFSMLADKDIAQSLSGLHDLVNEWHIAEIQDIPRAMPLDDLETLLSKAGSASSNNVDVYESLLEAYKTVKKSATDDDCILIFGSFHVVGELHDDILRT